CACTRSRMYGIWLRASLASARTNWSRSSSMNSRGVHVNTSTPSCRPPVSGTSTSPERCRGGAQKRTDGNGPGSTPSAAQPSAAAADPDGERPTHLVLVEGFVALGSARALHDLAGIGRDPDLGIDPRDGDARRAHLRRREDALLGHAMGVGLVGGALVDGLHFGDDAVRADLAGLRDLRSDHDEIVELEIVVVLEDHAELG